MGLVAEFVTIQAEIKRQTEKAICIEYHEELIWLPRSQIEQINFVAGEWAPKITMTAWIAKEKEII